MYGKRNNSVSSLNNSEPSCSSKKFRSFRDYEFGQAFPSTSTMADNSNKPQQNKIVLQDPLILLAERKREDNIMKKLNECVNRTATSLSPARSTEIQDIFTALGNVSQEAEMKMFPPGKYTFVSSQLFCKFNKDTIPGKDELSARQNEAVQLLLSPDSKCSKGILHSLVLVAKFFLMKYHPASVGC